MELRLFFLFNKQKLLYQWDWISKYFLTKSAMFAAQFCLCCKDRNKTLLSYFIKEAQICISPKQQLQRLVRATKPEREGGREKTNKKNRSAGKRIEVERISRTT